MKQTRSMSEFSCLSEYTRLSPSTKMPIYENMLIPESICKVHLDVQSELPRPIPRNSVESGHGCTSRFYFDIARVNMTLTLYNVTPTSRKQC